MQALGQSLLCGTTASRQYKESRKRNLALFTASHFEFPTQSPLLRGSTHDKPEKAQKLKVGNNAASKSLHLQAVTENFTAPAQAFQVLIDKINIIMF